MNPLTQVKNLQKISRQEVDRGVSESASWHAKFQHSPYIFVGGLDYDLTEGDLLAVFAQYGEILDVNLVRDKDTKKSRGFAFLAYYDQRSTNLAVDNLNGARISGRIVRVDHVANYKKKKAEMDGEEVPDEEEEEENKESDVGAPRWPNDRYREAEARSAAAEGSRPAGGTQQAWEMPGSVFALLNSVPKKQGTTVKTEEVGKKRKKEKDKSSKKKKRKPSRGPEDSSPSALDGEDGRLSPQHARRQHHSKSAITASQPAAFGPPRPPKAADTKRAADNGADHEEDERGRQHHGKNGGISGNRELDVRADRQRVDSRRGSEQDKERGEGRGHEHARSHFSQRAGGRSEKGGEFERDDGHFRHGDKHEERYRRDERDGRHHTDDFRSERRDDRHRGHHSTDERAGRRQTDSTRNEQHAGREGRSWGEREGR